MLAPDEPTQFIHARDLADFAIKCIEEKNTGIFNLVGPEQPCSIGELLETCKRVSDSDANFVRVSEKFIEEHDIAPWSELPLWIPESESRGLLMISNAKARAAGLKFKPIEKTVRETLEWARIYPSDYEMQAGLKPEREAELLMKLEEKP